MIYVIVFAKQFKINNKRIKDYTFLIFDQIVH